MCGIAGIVRFNTNPIDLHVLKKLTDVISHRGPDGEGQWVSEKGNVGLGHRRLSIIDLSDNGKQPMHYGEGRYTITFNGEIYNYIEIKEQLAQKGYRFKSDSDTEVLLALYDLKKENCLADLDGMFAFAIWDEKEQLLFCARDRFGEKPFHYYIDNDQFVFGSEIKQFWAYGIRKEVAESRLKDFLVDGLVDNEYDISDTFYKNIKRLDPACYLVLNSKGNLSIKKYWEIDLQNSFSGNIEEATEIFFNLFKESVHLRLRSDVSVGSSLSGGLDSSSIVMLIDQLKINGQKQTTFSARFKNFNKDEGKYIDEVVKNCRNIEVKCTWPDQDYFLNVLDKVIYHQDEPFGSASIIAQYAVMELAKQHNITVLLDGQGADEYLAGYLPYYNVYLNQLFNNKRKTYKKEAGFYNALHGHVSTHSLLTERETLRMKFGRYKRVAFNQKMPIADNALKKALLEDVTSSGLKTLLRYADRNSMAHSREVRLPFLSHKLVEFSFSLPDEYKLHEGWTKFVLRKAMEPILPKEICWRVDKIGYEPPQIQWMDSDHITTEIKNVSKQFRNFELKGDKQDQDWRLYIASKYL